jgi:amino acid transporter
MATAEAVQAERPVSKGLKSGALGQISTTVIATASVAPAYSLAATLGFIAVAVAFKSPAIAWAAFIPMIFASIGYNEMNKADPDCGTTFTWGTRALSPGWGWAGGWAIVAADILVMASLAQVAGQYVFLLFGAHGIGSDPASGWVLLVGVLWIIAMTYICYRGIELSANFQKALLSVEIIMLLVLSVTILVKVETGHGVASSVHPAWAWLNPFDMPFSAFASGLILMVFIYWGWDTALSVNEETKEPGKTAGRAAIYSVLILLVTYVVVIFASQAWAGIGSKGIGLTNPAHIGDVISILGSSVFGTAWWGTTLSKLLVLMVLSSAAASTQTTILPTARTTLSMGVYKALPKAFARMHPKYLTPTTSTLVMGGISLVLYAGMNYMSHGNVIPDAVTSCGVWIAFYYGLTALSCVWYYRRTLTSSARNLWMRGIIPAAGWLILWVLGGFSMWQDWDVNTGNSFTTFTIPGLHWHVGGVFVIVFLSSLIGLILWAFLRITQPAYFKRQTLTRSTPTLVPDN